MQARDASTLEGDWPPQDVPTRAEHCNHIARNMVVTFQEICNAYFYVLENPSPNPNQCNANLSSSCSRRCELPSNVAKADGADEKHACDPSGYCDRFVAEQP